MKCVAISDTHGMYKDINIPVADVFIHAGDILRQGKLQELEEFNKWLGTLPHQHKIIVAGNHDWCFERNESESREILTNGIYLQDEMIEIDSICFYGSPWQPWFLNWAFNLPRGTELAEKWSKIPSNTDVLITHGPPHGILDRTLGAKHVGCEDLRNELYRIKPKFHIFGHIHEDYGMEKWAECTYINASVNTARYEPINDALIFEI